MAAFAAFFYVRNMMRKQTQTKLFDFSDVGLDFCAGSKNLFPDRFKKMLALGYNEKTANSASISGNTITLTYGVTHGYVADRVLQVTAVGGFNKEVYIDSVTTNTVTCTVLDDDTTGLSGVITTKVASLGWELLYEQDNIHVYKMLHIDDTPRYVRFCFQNNATHRNVVAVCIGKSWEESTGFIDDVNALQSTAKITTPISATTPRFDLTYSAVSGYNNWTYSQGFSTFGKGSVVGSAYHFIVCTHNEYERQRINAILPIVTHAYDILEYPILLQELYPSVTSSSGNPGGNGAASNGHGHGSIGNIKVYLSQEGARLSSASTGLVYYPSSVSKASFLPNYLDTFNTTTAQQLPIYDAQTAQHLGYCYGAYLCSYAQSNVPTISRTNLPTITTDIDSNCKIVVHNFGNIDANGSVFLAFPLEEVKIGS